MIYYGVAYYPEHWPEERLETDADLMAKAGINVVRMAEFAWSRMEPREGAYNFDWLEHAINVLGERGIKTINSTPTAAPPSWLCAQYGQQIYQKTFDGIVRGYGSRRCYCFNSEIYHDYTRRIVTAEIEHFKGNQNIIGWQIDNEWGCHSTIRCYCEKCAAAFRVWLKQKHGTLEKLNDAWGNAFWSNEYFDWEHIPAPNPTPGEPNPSHLLDYYRFCSDAVIKYQKLQADIIKGVWPETTVTHNFMPDFYDQDYFKTAADLDVVSWDNYPMAMREPAFASSCADRMRATNSGRNFWIAEQQSGQAHWGDVNAVHRDGETRLLAYQAIAHGCDLMVLFRWRPFVNGAESFLSGIIGHDAREDGRNYLEAVELGAELKKLSAELEGTTVKSDVAIAFDYENSWTLGYSPPITRRFEFKQHVMRYYEGLFSKNINIDFAHPAADLAKYKMVLLPSQFMISREMAANLKKYVAGGGVIVGTFLTGYVDETRTVTTNSYPGPLRDLFGLRIKDINPLHAHMKTSFSGKLLPGRTYPADIWADLIALEDAEPLAKYKDDAFGSVPAITVNRYGKGKAYYVGTFSDAGFYADLMSMLLQEAGVPEGPALPENVVVKKRIKDDREYLFIMNFNNAKTECELDTAYHDMIAGKQVSGKIMIAPLDVLVLRK